MKKNRGMLLEKIINQTINYYEKNNLAFIEKKSLPIKFYKINENRQLFDAYIFKKSTVDYIGCFEGRFIAFEAKSTNEFRLPNSNIKKHQVEYLDRIYKSGGFAFFIILFSNVDEFYIVNSVYLKDNWKNSWSYDEIKKIGFQVELTYPGVIDFLPIIKGFS
ncbi:Holliday junction resolvase RecU [Mycoplasma zalophidermidis]|uniref:Holliday junction resolvase RecU n=1 Tax=Mycoplasma zalophidermidis TaxID=398174 RepID=A0ABS6DSI7_9MOLU|nr:Holliday junction resolvase RecU [Mycoplasma zalophidermidis]MBU4689516.1 Holliday junction resolvase RecU [Mycoplasma zalophidermidis]MBU4693394.1 Holliday junction resolvase RecU [Mycoplasma zalophidermidis]MCR8966308.1 Holliday junction resolvase RecU [Mycoplasma zalophidermidis]